MKIIPETVELNEDDIKEAIEYWLAYKVHEDKDEILEYDVELMTVPKAMITGYESATAITAKAT